MDTLKKKVWKLILKDFLIWMCIVVVVVLFLFVRSGSLSVALTVGLFFIVIPFKWVYRDYLTYKKELMNEANKLDQRKS
jgi:hypothetical protein